MNVKIFPSAISGKLRAPSSKSQAIRVIAASMLAPGQSVIRYPSLCDDALAMRDIARHMGAVITEYDESWHVDGGVEFRKMKIMCGESGLAARLMIALASLGKEETEIHGSGTLPDRHLGNIMQPLTDLGVQCSSHNGKLPYVVKGPIKGRKVVVDGSGGSQFVSGLLMALPLVKHDTTLLVKNLKSIPYVDMTLETLDEFGVEINHKNHEVFHIRGNQSYKPAQSTMEGDWSGAAFLLVAGALAGDIKVSGLNPESQQADRKIMDALTAAGVEAKFNEKFEIVIQKSKIKSFAFDATHCPDLFPPLVVLAAAAKGISTIKGVERLSQKESNRGLVLQHEFAKLGVRIEMNGDEMKITGTQISSGEIFSHHDHRIAMAGAVAGLVANGPVTIKNAECVSKSYPGIFDDLLSLGVMLKNINQEYS